jgi:hypothetical protein
MSAKNENTAASTAAGARGSPATESPAEMVLDMMEDLSQLVWELTVNPKPFKYVVTLRGAYEEIVITLPRGRVYVDFRGFELATERRKMFIDWRYKTVIVRENDELVAMASKKVKWQGNMYDVAEFVRMLKEAVRQSIESVLEGVGVR